MGTKRVGRAARSDRPSAAAGSEKELLGEYLVLLEQACRSGARATRHDLDAVRRLGGVAADKGVAAETAVRLYLASAWTFWQSRPPAVDGSDASAVWAAGDAVLRVVDDAVAALVEGYQARRREVANEEGLDRRRFVEDLLRGDADIAALVERAEPFGLDLARPHQIALASAAGGAKIVDAAANHLERRIVDRFGDREVLVAAKDDFVVVLVPETPYDPLGDVGDYVYADLAAYRRGGSWRVGVGRPHAGAYGVARSYEEAREALALMRRLHLETAVLRARDLLVYRVVGRDHAALIDLVQAALTPLLAARGGAEPLLRTLETYFASGGNATDSARRMHLSVRAVDYRLKRVRELTGFDVADAHARFTLHVAVVGARLLGWPDVAPQPS